MLHPWQLHFHAQLVSNCNGLLLNKVAIGRLPAVQVQQMQQKK